MVEFDLEAKPLPEIPFPNNLATVMDPSTNTGRRINVSLEATTEAERMLRRKVNELDGFGVFAPITIPFLAPLDLEELKERHALNHEFTDDAVLLVNVDRNSRGFGEAIPLDFGQGNYPLGLEWTHQYWDMDGHSDSPNLLFETHDEDTNGNGKLDPYEDIDFDGVLDKPNSWSGKPVVNMNVDNLEQILAAGEERPIDDLITFYEKETDTLVLWPVVALRERTTYAVVLTRNLVGDNGKPVRSPFSYVNHVKQNRELEPLSEVLARPEIGMSLKDVAFAWTFTTQSITDEMQAVRAGMYGHGPLAELKEAYPPDMVPSKVKSAPEEGPLPEDPYVMYSEGLGTLIDLVAGPVLLYAPEVVEAMKLDAVHTDYWVLGEFTTPYLLADQEGIATPMYPSDNDESFDIDLAKGHVHHGPSRVSFMCSIPKATSNFKPPFPVVVYGHGFSGATFEIFGFAGRFAQFGYALCGIDAAGHGLALPTDEDIDYEAAVELLLGELDLLDFYDAMKGGRIRDLDNDGEITSFDNGGDFWSYDLFHTRDMVRQSVIDIMQFIRIFRSLGTLTWEADTNGNGEPDDLMGDFNGDGTIDIGGSGHRFYPVWGQSMGAIESQILAAVEATAATATPISGGGGLIHIGIRSTNPGVPEAVWMPLMGPFIVFTPLKPEDSGEEGDGAGEEGDGEEAEGGEEIVEIAIMINDQHRENRPQQVPRPHYYPFARTMKIKPGDRVVVRNLDNQQEVRAFRHPDGRGFRVSIAADALDSVEKRPYLGLKDGDKLPVPVTCAPDAWSVPLDEELNPTGPVACEEHDLNRSLLFGDALEVEVFDGWDGSSKAVFNTFEIPVQYHGAIYPAGSRLSAIATGFGRNRNTAELRKLLGFASMIMGRGDPISYVRNYHKGERLDFSYDADAAEQSNVIIYHTIGDPNTPIATSLNLARAAGILEFLPGKEGNKTQNDRLLEFFVAEGVEWYWRHLSEFLNVTDWDENQLVGVKDLRWPDEFTELLAIDPEHLLPLHGDPDNLDNGLDEYGEPNLDKPVRATLCFDPESDSMVRYSVPPTGLVENEGGFMALRLPYYSPMGAHGIEPSNPSRGFNINNFVENQICVFMSSDGTLFSDDPCLADSSCEFLPKSVQKTGKAFRSEE